MTQSPLFEDPLDAHDRIRRQAQANANYFREPYATFFDTAGNPRQCQWIARPEQVACERFDPQVAGRIVQIKTDCLGNAHWMFVLAGRMTGTPIDGRIDWDSRLELEQAINRSEFTLI